MATLALAVIARPLFGSEASERRLDDGLEHLLQALDGDQAERMHNLALARTAFSTAAGNALSSPRPILALELTLLLESGAIRTGDPTLQPTLVALAAGRFKEARQHLTHLRDQSATASPQRRDSLETLAHLLQRLVELHSRGRTTPP